MRIEKGHVAGPELNGPTTAGDLGFARMMSTKKDFVGRVMAARPALIRPDRPVVVGIRPVDPARRLRAGAHILPKAPFQAPTPTRATSPRPASRRRSSAGSGSASSRTGASATARPSGRSIRCAERTMRRRFAIPSSTTPTEGASVAEPAWTEQPPLARLIEAGRPVASADPPGVRLTVRAPRRLVQVMARRGGFRATVDACSRAVRQPAAVPPRSRVHGRRHPRLVGAGAVPGA